MNRAQAAHEAKALVAERIWQVRAADDESWAGTLLRAPASYFVPAPARPLLLAARAFLYLRGASPSQRLLSAGVGYGAKVLAATADECGLALPTRTPRTGPPWHTSAVCWWVAAPLHAQDGSPP